MQNAESSVLDLAYRSVADQHRRYILRYLRDTADEVVQLDELVDHVVQEETNSRTPDRESVRIDLYHVHLPLLADAGVIDFDSRTEEVRYRSHSSVETLLDGEFSVHADGGEIEGEHG